MTTTLQNLLDSAMQLSESERAILADSLLQSLPEHRDSSVEDEWHAEVLRRSAEYRAGKSTPVPWSQVRQDVRRRLGLPDA